MPWETEYGGILDQYSYAAWLLRRQIGILEGEFVHGDGLDDLCEYVEEIENLVRELEVAIKDFDLKFGGDSVEDDGGGSRDFHDLVVDLADQIETVADDWPERDEEFDADEQVDPHRFNWLVQLARDEIYRAVHILQGADLAPDHSVQETLALANDGVPNAMRVRAAFERAVVVSQIDSIGPNERCAALTIAMASLACPERVRISIGFAVEDIRARFEGIELTLPEQVSGRVRISYLARSAQIDPDSRSYLGCRCLATKGAASERNIAVAEFVRTYFPMAHTATAQAAVLGVAWAMLQGIPVEESFIVYDGDLRGGGAGGRVFKVADPALYVRIDGGNVVDAIYPGLE